MKILLLTIFIAAASADNYCKGVYINEKYYDVDIIKEGINRVHEIVYNKINNTVYFTFEQIAKVPTRALAYLKLDDNSAGLIEGIRNATGLAMDQNSNRLYIGGSDGLFILFLNRKDQAPVKLPVDHDIKSLFFKNDILYFVNNLREGYKFRYSLVSPVFELQGLAIDKFVLDDDNNIVYLQNNKSFRVKIGTKMITSHEKVFASDIAVDNHFKSYICAKDGIYMYNKYRYVLDKVSDLKDIRKLAFMNTDEPIYVVVDTLVRLINNPVPCLGN